MVTNDFVIDNDKIIIDNCFIFDGDIIIDNDFRINELESGGMAGEMYNELKKEWDEEKKEREKENTQLLKLNCIMTREQALLAKKVLNEVLI